jgi:signal transduction histidine kinase
MGSRGRSIRLRIYFLVAIPLITMLGFFGYVAYTSVTNYTNLDRAPVLIRATSEPLTQFVSLLQNERRAAVTYLARPGAAGLTAYRAAVQATGNGEQALRGVLSSSATRDNATPAETAAISAMVSDVTGMTALQAAVAGGKVSALKAFAAYTKVITDQDAVFQAETGSMTQTVASTQGFGLISAVNAREDLSEQDALLAGALAAGSPTGPERVAFSEAAGRQADDTLLFRALFTPAELATYNTVMNAMVPAALQSDLAQVQQGVEAGLPLTALEAGGLSPTSWEQLTRTWQSANFKAATEAANSALAVDQSLADNARNRLWETAALGAASLILTLAVTIGLGRSINRRLTVLRRSALALANEQLPEVVARLRRGEPVDAAAQAPPVLAGSDEIGQVGQAIDAVRQTAIRSAVEEARVRQGVNDMFRNLARRSQSLLQRQLAVLDDMERRATDPDVLEDLFKMDHLTTRMRRHAEGLIILSGAAPGRSWSGTVKLIDVMRGAVAEVEDYARVTVSTQSQAALAGSAVTDVIHLLAELIENSTALSPPFTQVRVGGESVAHGFAIEIEDRGLGMTPQRLAELNERLQNPPELNPANTEQLGLFVVGQLARRHGISVTLRPSPYGGTTAVVLLPRALIVDDRPAAITTGGTGLAGAGSPAGRGTGGPAAIASQVPAAPAAPAAPAGAGTSGLTPGSGFASTGGLAPGSGVASTGGFASAGGWSANDGWSANGWSDPGAVASGDRGADDGAAGGLAERDEPSEFGTFAGRPGTVRLPATPASGNDLRGLNGWSKSKGWSSDRPAADGSRDGAAPAAAAPAGAGRVTPEVPVVTGVPVSRPGGSPAGARGSFDVFTPIRRDDSGGRTDGPAGRSYSQPYPDVSPPYPDVGAPPHAVPAEPAAPAAPGPPMVPAAAGGDSGEGLTGLPRRVRQASLAPELRSSAATAASGPTGVPRASAESLAVMRNTLSAMQRGWQQGRSESQDDTEGTRHGD